MDNTKDLTPEELDRILAEHEKKIKEEENEKLIRELEKELNDLFD